MNNNNTAAAVSTVAIHLSQPSSDDHSILIALNWLQATSIYIYMLDIIYVFIYAKEEEQQQKKPPIRYITYLHTFNKAYKQPMLFSYPYLYSTAQWLSSI